MEKEIIKILTHRYGTNLLPHRNATDEILALIDKHVEKQLFLHGVSKRFSEEQMIEASKYGYNYRDTTSFTNKNFDENCKNNTLQWLTTLK